MAISGLVFCPGGAPAKPPAGPPAPPPPCPDPHPLYGKLRGTASPVLAKGSDPVLLCIYDNCVIERFGGRNLGSEYVMCGGSREHSGGREVVIRNQGESHWVNEPDGTQTGWVQGGLIVRVFGDESTDCDIYQFIDVITAMVTPDGKRVVLEDEGWKPDGNQPMDVFRYGKDPNGGPGDAGNRGGMVFIDHPGEPFKSGNIGGKTGLRPGTELWWEQYFETYLVCKGAIVWVKAWCNFVKQTILADGTRGTPVNASPASCDAENINDMSAAATYNQLATLLGK